MRSSKRWTDAEKTPFTTRSCASTRIPANTHIPAAALTPLLNRCPLLDLQIGQGDRLVDLARKGIDFVVRAGEIADTGLIMRRIGIIEITCASPPTQ